MRRSRILLPALTLLAAVAAAAPAAAEPPRGGPPGAERAAGFVRHSGPNWVWFGPRKWDAVYSAYGISIFAPDGSSIDYGGSSTLNDGAPAQHFRAARNRFANLPGLSRVQFRKISRIRTHRPFSQGGTASQTMRFSARANGERIGGELGFQYALYVYDPQYAYQAQLYKGTIDDRDFKRDLRTLDDVWSRTAYSGPGLPINPSTGLP